MWKISMEQIDMRPAIAMGASSWELHEFVQRLQTSTTLLSALTMESDTRS